MYRHIDRLSFLALLLTLLAFTACKQPCKDVTCVHGACLEGNCLCNAGWTGPNCDVVDGCYARNCNNGHCEDGACVCDALWDGNDCSETIAQKFVGNWSFAETCTPSGQNGGSIISNAVVGTKDQVRLSNFWSLGSVTAMVNADKRSFKIERQMLWAGYDVESNSATLSSDGRTLNISYTVYTAGTDNVEDQCTAVWTKY